jgi:hypothetical protein
MADSIGTSLYDPTYYDQSGGQIVQTGVTDGTGSIQFPERTTFQQSLPGIMGSLGTAPTVAAPTVSAPTLGEVSSIPGFGADYWDSLYGEAQKNLNDQYFGSGGLQKQLVENLNSRGLLGSSIEQNASGNLRKDFASKLAGVTSDIGRQKTEQNYNEAKDRRALQQARDLQNAQMEWDARSKNAGWGFDASSKNAELLSAWKELGLRSALTEAGDKSKYDIGRLEQQVKLEGQQSTNESARLDRIQRILADPNVDLNHDQIQAILDSLFGNAGIPQATSAVTGDQTPPTAVGGSLNLPQGGNIGQVAKGSDGRTYVWGAGGWRVYY